MDLYTTEHAYQNKVREERVEQYRPSVACALLFLAGRGRGDC